MKRGVIAALIIAMFMGGCSSLFGPDKEGWRSSQKEAFLEILQEDRYMSLCDLKPLYEQVKESQDSRLMSKLLVGYVRNLANGCIDYEAFEASQEAKKEKKIETHYEIYAQKADPEDILRKLRAGASIEQILQPYIPNNPQFWKLTEKYRTLVKDANISQKVLQKVRLNIERAKIMNPHLGEDYALVNIPEFKVRLVEANNTVMKFGVIVGKRKMQTPIFSEQMRYIEINPQWNVPDSIMRKSYIRKIMENPAWIASQGMVLRKDTYSIDAPKVNPEDVNWSQYLADKEETGKSLESEEDEYIPYKLIQVPSKKNGLGRVKFIFPNSHAVYMHDTQEKWLFKRRVRCYSHGCVRLSRPTTLLKYVVTHYTDKDMETVQKWYDSLETKQVFLNKPLMVHIVYFTAYVDDDGKLRLFNDVYGFDKSQKLRKTHFFIKSDENNATQSFDSVPKLQDKFLAKEETTHGIQRDRL